MDRADGRRRPAQRARLLHAAHITSGAASGNYFHQAIATNSNTQVSAWSEFSRSGSFSFVTLKGACSFVLGGGTLIFAGGSETQASQRFEVRVTPDTGDEQIVDNAAAPYTLGDSITATSRTPDALQSGTLLTRTHFPCVFENGALFFLGGQRNDALTSDIERIRAVMI